MPATWFSIDKVSSLHQLKPGAHIHVIGVCGVAMAQLAIALVQSGFAVSGSDKEFYDPMASLLAESKIKTCKGYAAEHVPVDVDLVVIGNAVSYSNPEVAVIEARALKYSMFPVLLYELVIANRHSIVVSGTHGKSTTSALIASSLSLLDRNPSFFVGAALNAFPSSLVVAAKGAVSVVEGDEYDSCFFAKVPKFNFYRPDTWIITSIEYDHADIYPDLESIERVFSIQIEKLPASAHVIVCLDCSNIRRLLPLWRQKSKATFLSYGDHPEADFQVGSVRQDGFTQSISVVSKCAKLPFPDKATFTLPLPGRYNAKNALAVVLSCMIQGSGFESVAKALANFRGLKRRQEVRFNRAGVVLIDDFAHHPTAVRETLQGIRQAYPEARIIAVFEPRSNTSRRKVFQQEYVQGFLSRADQVVLCQVVVRSIDANQELLDVTELAQDIQAAGVPAVAEPTAEAIFSKLEQTVKAGDVVVVMSNGGFGGLVSKLAQSFEAKFKC